MVALGFIAMVCVVATESVCAYVDSSVAGDLIQSLERLVLRVLRLRNDE